MAVPTDCPMEFPAAMSTRAAMSSPNVGASATHIAPPPKTTRPMRWTLRQPMMSARRPIGIMNALIVSAWITTTQLTARSVTPKSSAMSERATNTIDWASTCVTNEMPMAMNAVHL